MNNYKVGDRLVLHVEGVVTEEHGTYVTLQPDEGVGTWSVEQGDNEWSLVEPKPQTYEFTATMTDVNPDLMALVVGHVCKPVAGRTDRELMLESALIETLGSLQAVVETPMLMPKDYDTVLDWLSDHEAELARLQAMP